MASLEDLVRAGNGDDLLVRLLELEEGALVDFKREGLFEKASKGYIATAKATVLLGALYNTPTPSTETLAFAVYGVPDSYDERRQAIVKNNDFLKEEYNQDASVLDKALYESFDPVPPIRLLKCRRIKVVIVVVFKNDAPGPAVMVKQLTYGEIHVRTIAAGSIPYRANSETRTARTIEEYGRIWDYFRNKDALSLTSIRLTPVQALDALIERVCETAGTEDVNRTSIINSLQAFGSKTDFCSVLILTDDVLSLSALGVSTWKSFLETTRPSLIIAIVSRGSTTNSTIEQACSIVFGDRLQRGTSSSMQVSPRLDAVTLIHFHEEFVLQKLLRVGFAHTLNNCIKPNSPAFFYVLTSVYDSSILKMMQHLLPKIPQINQAASFVQVICEHAGRMGDLELAVEQFNPIAVSSVEEFVSVVCTTAAAAASAAVSSWSTDSFPVGHGFLTSLEIKLFQDQNIDAVAPAKHGLQAGCRHSILDNVSTTPLRSFIEGDCDVPFSIIRSTNSEPKPIYRDVYFVLLDELRNAIAIGKQPRELRPYSLTSSPFCGGTTIARQIASALAEDVPVFIVNNDQALTSLMNSPAVMQACVGVSNRLGCRVLLIIDGTLTSALKEKLVKTNCFIILHVCRIRPKFDKTTSIKRFRAPEDLSVVGRGGLHGASELDQLRSLYIQLKIFTGNEALAGQKFTDFAGAAFLHLQVASQHRSIPGYVVNSVLGPAQRNARLYITFLALSCYCHPDSRDASAIDISWIDFGKGEPFAFPMLQSSMHVVRRTVFNTYLMKHGKLAEGVLSFILHKSSVVDDIENLGYELDAPSYSTHLSSWFNRVVFRPTVTNPWPNMDNPDLIGLRKLLIILFDSLFAYTRSLSYSQREHCFLYKFFFPSGDTVPKVWTLFKGSRTVAEQKALLMHIADQGIAARFDDVVINACSLMAKTGHMDIAKKYINDHFGKLLIQCLNALSAAELRPYTVRQIHQLCHALFMIGHNLREVDILRHAAAVLSSLKKFCVGVKETDYTERTLSQCDQLIRDLSGPAASAWI